jgi:hypothetical protein
MSKQSGWLPMSRAEQLAMADGRTAWNAPVPDLTELAAGGEIWGWRDDSEPCESPGEGERLQTTIQDKGWRKSAEFIRLIFKQQF